jgi:predicted permease
MFLTALKQMCGFMIMLFTGYVITRQGLLRERGVEDMTGILVKVLIPVMMFNALQVDFSAVLLRRGTVMFLGTFVMMGLALLLTRLTAGPLHVPARVRGDWVFGAMFPNVGFIGLPIIAALFQEDEAIFLTTAVIVASNLVFTSLGGRVIQMYGPGRSLDKASIRTLLGMFLRSPGMVGFTAGIICYCLRFRVPEVIGTPLGMLSATTAPLSMLTLGAMLTRCRWRDIFTDKYVYALCGIRLLAVPGVMWLLLRLSGAGPMMRVVGAIVFGMPGAAVMPGISLSNGGDPAWATKFTLLSTLLSTATVPLLRLLALL